MKNSNYTPVQLPNEAYKMLKEYCDQNDKKMGKFLKRLIEQHCSSRRLPSQPVK